jgi:Holliday junction DNA helicase RuvA
MLAYIKGSLEIKNNDYIVIDVGGLGYKINMSKKALENVGNIGDKVKVYTYYRVREDDISIFGFNTNEELRMFELLLSVSGVGAKVALTILSNIEITEFALAVITDDVNKIVKIPGIGKKSAQRIILELKDKLKAQELAEADGQEENKIIKQEKNSEAEEEAIAALQILGYGKKEIEKAFEKLANKNVSVEELIKKGLTILSQM